MTLQTNMYPWEQEKISKTKKVISITGTIVEWIVSFVLLIVFFTLLSPLLPTKNYIQTYVIPTGSMEPAVHAGSIAIIKPYKNESLKKEDIIAFISPNEPQITVLHRIVDITKKGSQIYYKTRGDNNNAPDNWEVGTRAIKGTLITSIPYLGHPSTAMRTKTGFALYMGIPAFIIVIMQLKKIKEGIDEEVARRTKRILESQASQKTLSFILIIGLSVNSFLIWGGIHSIKAQFSSAATVGNISIHIKDFVPPPMPFLISPASATTSAGLTPIHFSWSEVEDLQGSNPVSYEFESCKTNPDLNNTDCNFILEQDTTSNTFKDTSGYPEGDIWWHVRAIDTAGNVSEWTASRLLTIDNTIPTVELSITGSYTKTVEEKIDNGSFENDLEGWTKAGDVATLLSDSITNATVSGALTVTAYDENLMVRIGKKSGSSGKQIWENRLMKSFEAGAKTLSFFFNFFTRDFSGFDEPGFFVRLNGREAMRLDTTEANPTDEADGKARGTGWRQAILDLSAQNGEQINLAFYSGNTINNTHQSWAYLDKITTYFISAPSHATYTISGSDDKTMGHFEYIIDDTGWQIGENFHIENGGSHTVQYRAVDGAGNSSIIHTVKVITDTSAPDAISDISVEEISTNSAVLGWTAPGNDGLVGKGSTYDIRYSTDPITAVNFDTAFPVENVPVPQSTGKHETLQILGLNPDTTYYFAIKTKDEAPNTSAISNVVSTATLSGNAVNPGDIVINEMMWMGTNISSSDEWLELHNMTNRTIDMTGFKLTKFNGTEEVDMITNSFNGKSIAPNGYFLIANGNSYSGGVDSQLNVTPDINDSALDLSNTKLEIKLYDATETLIDLAWNGDKPVEGILITSAPKKFYSMERTSIPGDGSDPLNWYTCIDEASTSDFFDGDADERGTPRAANRSENEPFSHAAKLSAIEPAISLTRSKDDKSVNFTISNLSTYSHLEYVVTYESNEGEQGVQGEIDLKGQYEIERNNIILGTCSADDVCIYHSTVKNLQLIIELTTKEGKTKRFTSSVL